MREQIRRTLGGVGRSLVTAGTLILLFVAYQLWGTGVFTAQEQDRLKAQFEHQLAAAPTTTAPSTTTTGTKPRKPPASPPTIIGNKITPPADGAPIGVIHMPWSDYVVVEGTTRDDLKKGPGHYPATVFPGQLGNAGIAGHRTTYLHPFFDLDTMKVGDIIKVDMLWGKFRYRVVDTFDGLPNPHPVRPSDTGVVEQLADKTKGWLTLTTCNPKYSAAERLVLRAQLIVDAAQPPKPYLKPATESLSKPGTLANENQQLRDGLDGAAASKGPAVWWGIVMLLVGALWWWVYRHWRHPLTWFAGLIPFMPVLIAFYYFLERSLPAGY